MKNYALAVIAPSYGVLSETFIHRHATELLPEKTVIATRALANQTIQEDNLQPFYILGSQSKSVRWAYRSLKYLLKVEKLSPSQIDFGEYLHQHGVKVVLSEYLDHSLQWIEVAKKFNIRFFAHGHGYDVSRTLSNPKQRKRYLELNAADGIIVVSDHSKRRLAEIGLSAEKIHVIPCCVNVPTNANSQRNTDLIKCLAVGRMVPKKGPLLTLEAFRLASEANTKLRLDYVGDGNLFEDASKFIRDHGLSDKITLHGYKPNAQVLELMSDANIFIQHSLTDPETGDEEGLPVAILEAMARCLPVVATHHAGIPEAVLNGETGYVVDVGDVSGMANRIIELADHPKLAMRLGKSGWRRAKQHYSWEQERSKLLALLALEIPN